MAFIPREDYKKAFLALLIFAIFMAGTAAGLIRLRQDDLEREKNHLERLALTLSEQTALAFGEINLLLRDSRPLMTPELLTASGDSLHRLLHNRLLGVQQGQALMVFDRQGRMLGHSRLFPAPDISAADRDYFIAQRDAVADSLFISAPLRNRVNNKLMISLSRRLSKHDGTFTGVIMAAVEREYFSRLYSQLNLPEQARIELARDDGVILATYPEDDSRLESRKSPDAESEASLRASWAVPALHLTLSVSIPKDVVLQGWRDLVLRVCLFIALACAVLGVVAAIHLSYERQLRQKVSMLEVSERLLQTSQQNYKELFNGMLDGFATHELVVDAEGQPVDYRFLSVNPAFERLTGLSAERIVGRTVLEVMPDTEAHWIEIYGQVALSGRSVRFENYTQALDKYFEINAFRSQPGHFACVFQDVTERKRTAQALLASERKYRTLLENMRDGYAVVELSGHIVEHNAAFRELVGYTDEEIRTLTYQDITPEQWHEAEARIMAEQVFTRGYSDVYEKEYRRKDGSIVPVALRSQLLRDSSGLPQRLWALVRDISERKQAETELLLARDAAEAASHAKSSFLANMSHEIRTPLNGVMGMLNLLQNSGLNPEQSLFTGNALTACDRLTRLLSDILDLSRVEAGMLSVVREPFRLVETIFAVQQMFLPAFMQQGVKLSFFISEAVPLLLIGDAARLQQVLNNLVGNALKFTQQGLVEVEVHPLPSATPGACRLLFSVSDSGQGIAQELLDGLFTPFVQADEGFNRKHQGAGLGLSISRQLVTLMGGEIDVASRLGVGTAMHFCCTFGVGEPAETPSVAPPEVPPAPLPQRPLRILLAEDEAIGRMAVEHQLRRMGHKVLSVRDGRQAVEAMLTGDFDCILMDVQMPELDGVAATQMIRGMQELGAKAHVPIIALTAYAMAEEREKFLAAGMNEHLGKPVQQEELTQVLSRVPPRG